jgi:hypothetical protein
MTRVCGQGANVLNIDGLSPGAYLLKLSNSATAQNQTVLFNKVAK